MNDPNNLRLEFTLDAPDAPEIFANHSPRAHQYLREWVTGDRTVNNNFRDD